MRLLLIFFALTSSLVVAFDRSFTIDYDNNRFMLDGEPFQYISGSIHYFRIHPSQWLDRLKKVRGLGFNAIQYYIPWNFHETDEGDFEFEFDKNFTEFSDIANALGMYTLLRIGPYICAEWENGGLPWWLLNKGNDIKQRSNDTRFTQAVEKWFNRLLPLVKPMLRENGGPVLMVQIENEYGSYDACDKGYLIWLRDLVRHHLGDKIVLYTTDGHEERYLKCGTIPDVYPTVDFGVQSKADIDRSFAVQRKFLPNGKGPLVNSEFYPGWFLMWGVKEQTLPSQNSIIDSVKYMFSLGANINFYMIHGGTNFGFWNGAEPEAPLITSYDYSAPITEAGDITPNYIAIRNWIKSLADWGTPPTSIPKNSTKRGYGPINLTSYGKFDSWMCYESKISKYPLSFEHLKYPYGLVVYTTGTMINRLNDLRVNSLDLKSCPENRSITIVVENQGRQTYETINDYKGILSNVTLDGHVLTDWEMCNLHIAKDFVNLKIDDDIPIMPGEFGVYFGEFTIDKAEDTFIDTTGWGKGHILMNGYNIGRFWSSLGPQQTLYVPAQFLKTGMNTIIIAEMEGKQKLCDNNLCTIETIDAPIFTQAIKNFVSSPATKLVCVLFIFNIVFNFESIVAVGY